MAAAFISGAAVANSGSPYDMSALTCAGGVFTELQGFTGADWFQATGNGPATRWKREGGRQLSFTWSLAGGSLSNNSLKAITWTQRDEGNASDIGAVPGDTSPSSQVLNGNVNSYIDWNGTIIADQSLRTFKWRGANNTDDVFGTYQVTASFADSSKTMTPFNLGNGDTGFDISFTSLLPTFLNVRITCTAKPGATAYLFNQLGWLVVPTPPILPRGFTRELLRRGITGSPNA
jgi:hypothetical protein